MTSNTYNVGSVARVTGTFTNPLNSESLIDPTAVFCTVQEPGGTLTTYQYGVDASLIRSSVGVYYVDLNLNQFGRWYYRFYSTGTGQAADEKQLIVRRHTAV